MPPLLSQMQRPELDHTISAPTRVTHALDAFSAKLRQLRAAGHHFRMWWRDDDAYCDSTKLRRLLKAARGAPIALAVVPGMADSTLVDLVDRFHRTQVLQHGWMHINWSKVSARPSEYPAWRSASEVKAELRRGRDLLEMKFGDAFLPVFVPPWHSCSSSILRSLSDLGYQAISLDAALPARLNRNSAPVINIEIDLSDWKTAGSFIGIEALTKRILRAFDVRARWDSESPVGLLTHHAFLTPQNCDHLRDCLHLLEQSEIVQWMTCADVVGEIGSSKCARL